MAEQITAEGTIVSVQLCPGRKKAMQVVQQAEAIANFGLKGDRHALADSSRQVLLIEKETLDNLQLQSGDVKENITTTRIELMILKHRDRIQIGGEVILEITKSCSPCSRMDEIRPGLLKEIAGRRGMLARVIQGGMIINGDSINVIDNAK